MKNVQIKLYSINELSKEIKEKVIEKFKNNFDIDLDFFNYDVIEDLKSKGWNDVKLQYSLSYCQGDGLSFSGKLDLKWFLENIYSKKLTKFKIWALNEYIYKVISKGNTGHYSYSHKNQIEFEHNYPYERKHIEKLLENVLDEVKDYYVKLCNEYEKQGYNEIDYQLSNEYITEFLENNEYEFFENGQVFNGQY